MPHDSQALAGAGATGDSADAATTDAAAAAPRTGGVPRPDAGALPPTAPPGKRREGFSEGPEGRVAATVGATAALPLVATDGCFRARRDGGGGDEEGEGVTTEEGGVTTGGSLALEAGAYRQFRQRPVAHTTHHAKGSGKTESRRRSDVDTATRQKKQPLWLSMDARVAGAAAASG